MKSYSEYKKDCLEKRQKKIDSMKIDVRTDFFNRYDRVNNMEVNRGLAHGAIFAYLLGLYHFTVAIYLATTATTFGLLMLPRFIQCYIIFWAISCMLLVFQVCVIIFHNYRKQESLNKLDEIYKL
jgi:hypothetical protein